MSQDFHDHPPFRRFRFPRRRRGGRRLFPFAFFFFGFFMLFIGGIAALLYWAFTEYSGVRNIWLLVCGAPSVVIILAFFTVFRMYMRFGKPMEQIFNAIDSIAEGNLSVRVPENKSDMFSELVNRFNKMVDELERAEQQRRNLTADIAHELRTPLHIIQGNLEAMLDGVLPTSPQEIATIRDEAALLTRLVADLRLLSLAESGQLKLERVRTNIAELTTHAVEPFHLQAQSSQVELKLELASNLPQVEVDTDRITQVIRNLLSNALRHTPEGGQVTISCERDTPHQVVITVSDTGEGISPADLPFVFDRFYRADKSRSRISGGSGIGLTIVKQLVEAHGGTVWVENQPPRGTTFGFTLPS